jgi:hypothetical protein
MPERLRPAPALGNFFVDTITVSLLSAAWIYRRVITFDRDKETLAAWCHRRRRSLPYLSYERLGARRGLGRGRGKFGLECALWLNPDGQEVSIYQGADKTRHDIAQIIILQDLGLTDGPVHGVTLTFLTPTHIVHAAQLASTLDFHVLMHILLRRLSNLMYFHAHATLDVDFRGIIAAAQGVETVRSELCWYDWEGYSARQNTRMTMGGVMGQVTYRGNLQPFLPLLNVGKGTSFGLGKYHMEMG